MRGLWSVGVVVVVTTTTTTVGGSFIPEAASGLIDNNGRCFIAGDVVILQDTTGSFMDDMPIVRAQIPDLIERVGAEFPGTLFGIAEFRDKPYFPLGELTDFCYKLRYGSLTNNPRMLQFAWDILQPSGGGDWYESQYQAGIDVVSDEAVGWRPLIPGAYNLTTQQAGDESGIREAIAQWESGNTSQSGARIVVMITDAEPHVPGDLAMCAPGVFGWEPTWYCPQNLPPNPGEVVDGDFETTCSDYDYPSEKQFVQKALEQNVLFIFLTTKDVAPFYRRITEQEFKNPPELTQIISDNSSNLTEALITALKKISEVGCQHFPTTTTTTTTTTTEEATTTVEEETTTTTTTLAEETTTTVGEETTTTVTTEAATVATQGAEQSTDTTTAATTTTTTTTITTEATTTTAATTTTTTPATTTTTTTTSGGTVVTVGASETSTTSATLTATVTAPGQETQTTAAQSGVETTGGNVPPVPGECPECPPCPAPPCPACPCATSCAAPPCDELVIKLGAQIAKLDLSYNN